ncbi:hypothetical protein E4U42_006583 [Claviceps africana]|uniref:RanBD1 domain-containing protein n=1 Tax=Claviceps africana TaxID=83212 RepID=A0A8K0NEX3_9HYPO|nr:hypothetical protein E4U42_006583 [Claviceps africana]
MVTFSIPGDDIVETANGTPRSRSQLPFAKRASAAASPFGSSTRKIGTPYASSSRKLLATRDEVPSSSSNQTSVAMGRNIFRASAINNSPFPSTFSPSIPNSTMKKVFAPGATPEPSRVYRESIAQATPRGMAARTTTKELFTMRIASPPPELTGEFLTQKVPKEWNAKGSIYADQFLAHLCPPELDEEQRRQFFCILDLRRLKYAANEVFAGKDWKLNVINFAKEFEKSRSIILLRYGLYEFQNVKPSKDVLKRWRREHGLPEPEDDEADVSTPSRPSTSKKRKAADGGGMDPSYTPEKRRALDQTANRTEPADPISTPTGKNKRKASVSEEQPAKMQKSTPSSAKSLFEKIANKPAAVGSPAGTFASGAKPNLFNVNKPATSSNLARSVFTATGSPGRASTPPTSGLGGSNIFGYLSDASSAKNSGADADADADADAESQSDSEQDKGRSLFDRVTKDNDGQPVRVAEKDEKTEVQAEAEAEAEAGVDAEAAAEVETETVAESRIESPAVQEKPAAGAVAAASAAADQTWNPTTTPIKFAPSTSSFGSLGANSSSSLFATKTTAPSNLFGAAKQGSSSIRDGSTGAAVDQAEKDGNESDKENESQRTKKALFDSKTTTGQSPFGSSPFTAQSANSDPRKSFASFFGGSTTTSGGSNIDTKPSEASTAPSLLVQQPVKPSEAAAPSFLFGAKAADTNTTNALEAPSSAPTSIFGGRATSEAGIEANSAKSNNMFGATAASTAPSLFGSSAFPPARQPMFGATSSATTDSVAAKTDAPKLTFGFGKSSTTTTTPPDTSAKPLFGAPKSPPDSAATGASLAGNNLFGSPMKQDNPSPAKKISKTSGMNNNDGDAAPAFKFNGAGTTTSFFAPSTTPAQPASALSSKPTGGIGFGGATSLASTNAGSGSLSFNFNFGGASSTAAAATPATGFNNPFSVGKGGTDAATPSADASSAPAGSAAATAAPAPSSVGAFTFGAASSAPSGTSSPFQFGGGAPGSGGASLFNFTAGGAAPQGTGSGFGSNQGAPVFNLQPPAGGSTTTGTNSPQNLGGGSSLATTPAAGTPEPAGEADAAAKHGEANDEDGERHEQVNLADAVDDEEEVLHEVRAKVLKFVPASENSEGGGGGGGDKAKSKSPWSTQGVGQLRILKHKDTKLVRLLLRAEPRGHVALNRALLATMSYKADEKYVKLTTSNEKGNGLETWMIQVKTKELAKHLADAMEENKGSNKG